MKFSFLTDDDSRLYCQQIIKAMELLFDIDPNKGYELLNGFWRGKDWRESAPFTYLLYHERQGEWAERIGNPKPYGGTETELKEWKTRQEVAASRIRSFRENGQYKWLWPGEEVCHPRRSDGTNQAP
jgi:hypothetical protein